MRFNKEALLLERLRVSKGLDLLVYEIETWERGIIQEAVIENDNIIITCKVMMANTGTILKPDPWRWNPKKITYDRSTCDSHAVMSGLLDLYWEGLRVPLPFFPETSLKFFEKNKKVNDESLALSSARGTWDGGTYSTGEGENQYYRLLYRGMDPLSSEFMALADFFWSDPDKSLT